MRIAVLTSQCAPGLDGLILDPARGPIYQVTTVVSASRYFDRADRLAAQGIAFAERPVPPRNLRERERTDAETLKIVRDADYLFLDDYRYIVTRPLLDAFAGRIVAFHDGDLTVLANGRRAYAGPHAVRNAILAGDRTTRASAFLATDDVGEGPLLLLGASYPVSELATAAGARGDFGDIDLYACLHRRWMVKGSYGTLLRKAAELVSFGVLHVAKDTVWVDGVPGPCRLGEAPAECWSATSPPRRGIPSSCPFIQTEVHS